MRPPLCVWREGDEYIWRTGCGYDVVLYDPPKVYDIKFCPHCGRRVVEQRQLQS